MVGTLTQYYDMLTRDDERDREGEREQLRMFYQLPVQIHLFESPTSYRFRATSPSRVLRRPQSIVKNNGIVIVSTGASFSVRYSKYTKPR